MKQTVTVENMSCQNCVRHVTEHFSAMPSVSDVTVDLDEKTAVVTTEQAHSLAEYQAALDDTVYEATAVN